MINSVSEMRAKPGEAPGNPAISPATPAEAIARATGLPVWAAPHGAEILPGGMTNFNVKLHDAGKAYVVRIGGDIDAHLVKRFNELACHRAAEAAGLSPRIVHAEAGVLAMDFIEGQVLDAQSAAGDPMIDRIAALLRRLHSQATRSLRGPVLVFWVFHVLRDYDARLRAANSRYMAELPRLSAVSEALEEAVGPVTLALAHNDLLPSNLLDDGRRLWLLDWDYGGFNTPLFDLAGIASNCGYSVAGRMRLLEAYYGEAPSAGLLRRLQAMMCASLLRETLWSMVSEITSNIAFDYAAYTEENRARFDAAYADFLNC